MNPLLRLRYLLEYFLTRVFLAVLGCLPLPVIEWIARRVGDIGFYIMPERRRTALENLSRAFGESLTETQKKNIAIRSFESMALGAVELFLASKILKDFPDRFTMSGYENLLKVFQRGKGLVMAISHLGSWELLSFICRWANRRGVVVVKRIRNPYLNKEVNRQRSDIGVAPIIKDQAAKLVFHELKNNHMVGILMDQWAGSEGAWINFFGHPTSTTTVPVRVARKTGCGIVPGFCLRTGAGKYEFQFLPEIPISDSGEWEKTATEKLNQVFEEHIRKYPDQWIWGHRRWKTKPSNLREI